MIGRLTDDARDAYLSELTHSVSPGIDLFLKAILSGLLLGLAFRFEQRTLLIAAALAAPSMAPLAGMALASVSGSMRVFIRLLAAMGIAIIIQSSVSGLVGGLNIPPFTASSFANSFATLHPIDLALLLMGAILMCTSLARGRKVNPLASAAVAYEILIPAGVVGLGLVRDHPELWQGGLLTFGAHLVWAAVICVGTLLLLGFRPLGKRKLTLATSIILMAVVALLAVGITTIYALSNIPFMITAPAPTPTRISIPTPTQTPSPSATRQPTSTPTTSPSPSITNSPTVTPTPERVLAIIWGTGDLGAYLREGPSRETNPLGFLQEGTLLEVLGEPEQVDEETWWNVRVSYGDEILEGWVMHGLLATVTPTVTSTSTPADTPTPSPTPE
jgi:hypothetical protein